MTQTTTPSRPTPTTTAFFAQSALSFGIATLAVGTGIAYLPVDAWTRGFLAIGCLFLVSSAFTLAKCVRDQQEQNLSRTSSAQLHRILAEQQPATARTAA